MWLIDNIYNNNLFIQTGRDAIAPKPGSALAEKFDGADQDSEPVDAQPLDDSNGFLGMGRSLTFPLPQWRGNDTYRTVFFDEGQGRTIVFVHGLGGNATNWEFTAPNFADRFRVAGLDLVGCGWSLKPDMSYTLDVLCDHLLDFLDRRRIHRATLVGHSLGGAVCSAAALRRPDLVESLVLICPAGIAPLPAWMRVGLRAFLYETVLFPFLLCGAKFIVNNVFVDRDDENRHVRWFRRTSLRDAPGYPNLRDFARVGKHLCRDVVKKDLSDQLPSITAPVLVLLGDHDKLSSMSSVLRDLNGFPRVRTVVISRCGHMPMVERPEEALFHMERFLEHPP